MNRVKEVKKAYRNEIKACDKVLKIYKDRIKILDRFITTLHNKKNYELKDKIIKDLKKYKQGYLVTISIRKNFTELINLQKILDKRNLKGV